MINAWNLAFGTLFSFKSKAWQVGLITGLLVTTCLLSLWPYAEHMEGNLFLYIVGLQPADRAVLDSSQIRSLPQ